MAWPRRHCVSHPPPFLSACDGDDHLTFERKGLVVSNINKQAWNELKIIALTYETVMSPKSFIFRSALAGGFSLKGLWEGCTNTNNLHCRISTELKSKERPARRPQWRPPQNQPMFARKCYLDLVSCVWNIIFRKRASKCADYCIYESDVSQEYTYLGTQTSSLVSLDFRSNHILFIFDDNPDFTNLYM